jgi:DNA-binding response OmpR family regulator
MKIHITEDNPKLLAEIRKALLAEGFVCDASTDFEHAIEKIMLYSYDVFLVDVNLPDGSGLDLVEKIKENHQESGIIIVSAREAVHQKIEGLDLGADDYIAKPFDMAELIARVRALFRRKKLGGHSKIKYGIIEVDTRKREVYIKNESVDLTRSEYDIFLFFLANPTRVLTREAIAEHIWGDNMDMADSFDFIYSHIKNLRRKITGAGATDPLKSVYGVGYKLNSMD